MLNDNKQSTKVTSAAVSRKSLDKDITRNSKGIVELHLNNPSKTKLGVPLLTTDISLSSFKDVIDNVFTHFIPPASADPTVLADDPVLEVPILPPDGTFIRQPEGRIDMEHWTIWIMVNGRKQQLTELRSRWGWSKDWQTVQVMLRERDLTYKSIQIINNSKEWESIPIDPSPPTDRSDEWTEFHPSETGYEALPPNDPGKSTYWDQMRVKYEGKMISIRSKWGIMPPTTLRILINGKWRRLIGSAALAQSPEPTQVYSEDGHATAADIYDPTNKKTWGGFSKGDKNYNPNGALQEYEEDFGFTRWKYLIGKKPSAAALHVYRWEPYNEYYLNDGETNWKEYDDEDDPGKDIMNLDDHLRPKSPEHNPDGNTSKPWIKSRIDAINLFNMISRTNNLPTFSDNDEPYVDNSYAWNTLGSLWFTPEAFTPWIKLGRWKRDPNSDDDFVIVKDSDGNPVYDTYYGIDNDHSTRRVFSWHRSGMWFPPINKIPRLVELHEERYGNGVSVLRGANKIHEKIHGISYEILEPTDPLVARSSAFNLGGLPPLTIEEYKEYLDKGPDKWNKDWLKDYYPEGDRAYYKPDAQNYDEWYARPFMQGEHRDFAPSYDAEAHGYPVQWHHTLRNYIITDIYKKTPISSALVDQYRKRANKIIAHAQEHILKDPQSELYELTEISGSQGGLTVQEQAMHVSYQQMIKAGDLEVK